MKNRKCKLILILVCVLCAVCAILTLNGCETEVEEETMDHMLDGAGMQYDWMSDLISRDWIAEYENKKYTLKFSEERLVLLCGEEQICDKEYYLEYCGERVTKNSLVDMLRSEDGEGFGEFSRFVCVTFFPGNYFELDGIIEKDGQTSEVRFKKKAVGFEGMTFGMTFPALMNFTNNSMNTDGDND